MRISKIFISYLYLNLNMSTKFLIKFYIVIFRTNDVFLNNINNENSKKK